VVIIVIIWLLYKRVGWPAVKKRASRDLGYAKFFTVVKKVNEDGVPILRTILDCRSANEAFADPLPVNLATLPELLQAFDGVQAMRTMDLRHWYHQLPISADLSCWFTVAFGAFRLEWRVLPMGWKWACFIAQAVTSYLAAGEDAFTWQELPNIIRVGNVRLAVVYDNILAGGPKEELDCIWKKIHGRITEIKAIIKEDVVASFPGETISTLGLEWAPSPAGLRWRLLPKFVDKAIALADNLNGHVRIKAIASAIGLVAWSRYAARGDMFDLQPYYRSLSVCVAQHGWGGTADAGDFPRLPSLLRDVALIGWQSFIPIRQECLMFTDAHVSGFGAVGGDPVRAIQGIWKQRGESKDMFFLEAIAAKIGVMKLTPDRCRIYLAVDNRALMFALAKRSTACPRTAVVLAQLSQALRSKGSSLVPGWIPTEYNPADELSRGRSLVTEKLVTASSMVEWTGPEVPRWGSKLGRVVG
jgi:hypothetical protein